MLNPAELAHIKWDDAKNQWNRAFWGTATDRRDRMRFYQNRVDFWAAVRDSLADQMQICASTVQFIVTDVDNADRISINTGIFTRNNRKLRKRLRIVSKPPTTPLRDLRVDI